MYVAHLKVEQVEKASLTPNKREVSEVTQITVKAETMDAMKSKLTAHIDIISED